MLRGTLVLFAGLFTVVLLRRPLYIHHWLGEHTGLDQLSVPPSIPPLAATLAL